MKVLIHTDEYYPTAQACAYRMQSFAETFVSLGDEITVITSSANKANRAIDSTNRKEKIIYVPTIRMKKKTTLMRMLNNLSFGIVSVISSIRVGKIDVVITTSPPPLVSIPGWFIAKCKGSKLIYDVRDIWPDVALEMGYFSEQSFFCKAFRKIARFMYKHADIVTTVSSGKVDKINELINAFTSEKPDSFSNDKVWLVGNGFDESIVKSEYDQIIVEKYGLENIFTCVYIGNIGLAQGLGTLLNVAAKTKHKNIQFLCFGMGAEKELLEKRVKDEHLTNVRFCGAIDHNKVFSILSKAKLAFIPLKNGNMKDSIPTKIYEALGIGCPVLLVAEGDAEDIVASVGLGRSVSPDNLEKIVNVFDEMIDNYDDFEVHKEEAIHLIHEKYSRQTIAEEFYRKLNRLCNGSS